MSTQQGELSQFLTDLHGRRMRLQALVGSSEDSRTAVLDELGELAEQLIVADEELRVQQEELEDSRAQVEELRAQLPHLADEAWVVTDGRGLVLRTTVAADRLARLSAARMTPRPIAIWFVVADRTLIRRMIGRSAGTATQVLERALLSRTDGSTVPVRVALTRSPDLAADGGPLLRWELSRLDTSLRVVAPSTPPGPAVVLAAEADQQLSAGLARMISRLAPRQPLPQAWSRIVSETAALVPAADHVGVVLYRRRAPGQPLAATDPVAGSADAAQFEQGGPVTVTLAENRPEHLPDTAGASAWPEFAAAARALGIGSVLTVPLTLPRQPSDPGTGTGSGTEGAQGQVEQRVGALTLYSDRAGAFDPAAEATAAVVAAHAATALLWLNRETSLQEALSSRQLIGEAVGVLVERQKLTSAAAFEVLVQRSQHLNLKLRDLARIIVETGQDPATIRHP